VIWGEILQEMYRNESLGKASRLGSCPEMPLLDKVRMVRLGKSPGSPKKSGRGSEKE